MRAIRAIMMIFAHETSAVYCERPERFLLELWVFFGNQFAPYLSRQTVGSQRHASPPHFVFTSAVAIRAYTNARELWHSSQVRLGFKYVIVLSLNQEIHTFTYNERTDHTVDDDDALGVTGIHYCVRE